MFETLRQDLVLAVRGLNRSRGTSVLAMASLAIGIAANSTIFSVIHALEFPRLLYPDPSRIIFVESRNDVRGLVGMLVSPPDARDIAASSRTLASVSLIGSQSSVLHADGRPMRISGKRVAPGFFGILGVPPAAGRVLSETDVPGVIVIGDSLWRSRFGGDPAIVGRAVALDGGTVTVVGIMPPRFDADADFWTPLAGAERGHARDDRQFELFARLDRSATLADVKRELAEISARLAADYPATNKDWVMVPTELTRLHGRDSRATFLLLQAAVGFVLLIACANIANILLARGTARHHELAVRLSLGATRARLVRLLLTEAVVLSLTGGLLGLLLSAWGIEIAASFAGFPDAIDPELNGVVLAFAFALSIATGVACGVVPAFRSSSVAPDAVLRESGRGLTGEARGRLRSALAASQIATALVLAVCAALMLRTIVNRQRVDLGFDPASAVRATINFSGERYAATSGVEAALSRIIEELRARADIEAAGAITWALPTPAGAMRQLTLPSKADAALPTTIRRGVEAVTPGYFEALGAPLRLGRAFTDGDRAGAAPVAIVNEELARHMWPGGSPIGELLRLGTVQEGAPVVTVVGVAPSIRRSHMHDVPVARVYVPFAQYPNRVATVIVRGRTTLSSTTRVLEEVVQRTDSSLLLEEQRSLMDDVARYAAPVRMIATLLGGFGATGVLLAALGVFGTMSYTVSQRRRDLAVRCALGAERGDIVRLVLGGAARVAAVGVGAGLVLAILATRALASFLFGVSATDPLTYALAAAAMFVVALVACYRPARLAAMTDPLVMLRQ